MAVRVMKKIPTGNVLRSSFHLQTQPRLSPSCWSTSRAMERSTRDPSHESYWQNLRANGWTMNGKPVEVPSLDELLANPGKAATLSPEAAQAFLIGLASIQPILIQRALMGTLNGQENSGLLTIKDVAQRLKVSEYRAYELARQGVLKAIRLGKSVRVTPSAVTEYLAQNGG